MYPGHGWHHHPPSRILWFLIGAGAATFWIGSKDAHNFRMRHCSRHQIPPEAYQAPTSTSPPTSVSSVPQSERTQAGTSSSPPPQNRGWGFGWNSSWQEPPTPPPPFDRWEEDRLRMQELSGKANDKFTEISEATLDTVLNTVETLKAKLAEHRAQREQQAKELQAMREQQMRQYEEWKKSQPPRHLV